MPATGAATSDPPELDLRQLPPVKCVVQVIASEVVEASLPIVSSPHPDRTAQDVPSTPIDPLLLASSLVSYFPLNVDKWNGLGTKEAEDRLLMNAAIVNYASLVRKICLDRGESVPSIPRPALEVEADAHELGEKVDCLKEENKKLKGKVDRAKAAKEGAEKRAKEAEDKVKDAIELFKNGEAGREFALEFAVANNADIISHLLGDPEGRKRFLNLFEESNEGGLYKYRAIARGEYIGKCNEQEMIYDLLSQKLGGPGAERLKEKLDLPNPYDPIPPPDETVFPLDPDAKRNEEEEDEGDAEGNPQGE